MLFWYYCIRVAFLAGMDDLIAMDIVKDLNIVRSQS